MSETATIHGYKVVFDQGEINWGAYVEDIPGVCFTVANTREECERQIADAIEAHLEALALQRRGTLLQESVSPQQQEGARHERHSA